MDYTEQMNQMSQCIPEPENERSSDRMEECSWQTPGMAYVPWQHFEKMYDDLDKAYRFGTVFPELNKPFTGRRCVK